MSGAAYGKKLSYLCSIELNVSSQIFDWSPCPTMKRASKTIRHFPATASPLSVSSSPMSVMVDDDGDYRIFFSPPLP